MFHAFRKSRLIDLYRTWISTKYMHANVSIGNTVRWPFIELGISFRRQWVHLSAVDQRGISVRMRREFFFEIWILSRTPCCSLLKIVVILVRLPRHCITRYSRAIINTFKYWMWILLNIWMWDDHDCSDISFIIVIPVSQFYRQFCELYLKENAWPLFFINYTLFVYYR